jgi:hypothetical protein
MGHRIKARNRVIQAEKQTVGFMIYLRVESVRQ